MDRGYSSWGHKASNMAELLTLSLHFLKGLVPDVISLGARQMLWSC